MAVSFALNGHGLGAIWGEEKEIEMLKDAGFSEVEVKNYNMIPSTIIILSKRV